MKVLWVRDAAGERAEIALHRQVTVVRGLDPLRRSWLIETLGSLGASRPLEAGGEIVAHGVVLPLDRDSLALLDLVQPAPAVVRAEDLPGHDPRIAEAVASRDRALVRRRDLTTQITEQREALGAAVAERTDALAAIDEIQRGEGPAREALAAAEAAKARIEAELASAADELERQRRSLNDAVLARDAAVEARAAVGERLDRARDRHRDAMGQATAAAAALEQARPLVDDDPTDLLVARRSALATAEAAAAEADPDADSSPVRRRLAALERRRMELIRLQEAVGDAEAAGVAAALERLSDASTDAAPVVAALALADTWRDLHQQIDALDAGVSEEEHEAELRVAQARQSVIEAEVEFNQPVLTPEQIAKVEAAHTAVLEAQDRSEGRFGGSRLRKKLEDSRNEERRVLERLGFSTYADYMMSSSSRGVGPANRLVLETARAKLTAAQEALDSLPGAADRARRRTELLQRRDAVSPKVASLIGHEPTGPEAEEELRHLREPATPDDLALADLASELEAVGVAIGPAPHERDDLVLLARFYLSEHEAVANEQAEVVEALAALDAQISMVRRAHDRGQQELPELHALPALAEPIDEAQSTTDEAQAQARTLREARWAEVEAAQQAVAEAEAAVARHREATTSLSTLEADLHRAGIEEELASAAVAAAEAEVALADGPAYTAAVTAAEEAEAALARAASRQDEAERALAALDVDSVTTELRREAEARLAAAERAVTEAAAAEQSTAASLAEVDASFAAAVAAEEAAQAEAQAIDRLQLVEDLDWQLLSRLAALRSVGLAGSMPLVLDDPFAVLDDDEVSAALDRLGRMADAVQIVVVTEREAAVAWAAQAGSERALVHSG